MKDRYLERQEDAASAGTEHHRRRQQKTVERPRAANLHDSLAYWHRRWNHGGGGEPQPGSVCVS